MDGIMSVVLTANRELERLIQFLYLLELCCDTADSTETKLSANAQEFRPKRQTAEDVIKNIYEIYNYEFNEEL